MKHLLLFIFLFTANLGFPQKMLLFRDAVMPKPAPDGALKSWVEQQQSIATLSSLEREFYYWVNYSRANPRLFFDSVIAPITQIYPQLKGENLESLRSEVSKIDSLPLLTLNPNLIQLAKGHAIDITSSETKPSHNSTNGESFADRFRRQNFQNCGAENLSYGAGAPVLLLTLLYLDIDVPTLGHRKTLLNPKYRETGIGAGKFKDNTIFLVEDFACSQN